VRPSLLLSSLLPAAVAAMIMTTASACGSGDGGDADAATDAVTDAPDGGGCGTTPPTVTETVAGAVFPGPGDYTGGATAQLDLDGPDPGWTWNDPHVLKVGSQYWMYASSTVSFDFPVKIWRLVSNDGISWTRDPVDPVLGPGAAGSFDAGGVETPAVVHFGGRFHMFYTAYPIEVGAPGHSVFDYRVGHATSCDGVTWTRDPANPVVAPSGQDADPGNDWYGFIVGEPGPVVYHDQLWLYFTAVGVSATLGTSLQVIGVTRSDDGDSWSAPALALEPDQGQYPRVVDPGPPMAGWVGFSTPNAIVFDDQVHLFTDVAYDPDEMSWRQVRLHHAVSASGLDGWQQDTMAIAAAGDFPYAVDEIRSPDALVDGTTLRLYFAGHELDGNPPEHFAIGMLTAPLVP